MSSGEYEVTTDPARLDVDAAHAFLSEAYWSVGIPRATVARAMANSLCFGLLHGGAQVGMARVITDRATFGYLADVYVLPEHRGRGGAQRMMRAVMTHPDLQGLRRVMLVTRDAHGLYARHGFKPVATPDRMMELLRPDLYRNATPG